MSPTKTMILAALLGSTWLITTAPASAQKKGPDPAVETYEFDDYKESGGTRDEFFRLVLTLSDNKATVKEGIWIEEWLTGEILTKTGPNYDFICDEPEHFGKRYGKVKDLNTFRKLPESIEVTWMENGSPTGKTYVLNRVK